MSSASVEDDAKPKLGLDGLASEWENFSSIRDHLRQQNAAVLFPSSITENVKSVNHQHIFDTLKPLVERMAQTPGMPQPGIDRLKEEITHLYEKCSTLPDDLVVMGDGWMIRKFCSFVKMKVRTKKVSTVENFQELCLILKPDLKDLVMEVRRKHQAKLDARKALMESKQKPDPDAYDAEDAASSTSGSNDDGSDGSDAESQDQDINDEIRGQDIPDQPQPMAPDSLPLFGDGHPISSAGATVATPAHPAPETTRGPSPDSAANSLSASLPSPGPLEGDSDLQLAKADQDLQAMVQSLAAAKSQLQALQERKRHLNASIAKMKAEPMEPSQRPKSSGKDRALPTPVRGHADNLETQPIDIMNADVPKSPPAVASPGLTADQNRKKFKDQCKPEKAPQPTLPPPSAAVDLHGPGHAEAAEESAVPGAAVLLRTDQLAFKSTVKSSRKKGKRGAGKRKGKKARKSKTITPQKKVHRGRRVLRSAAAAASSSRGNTDVTEVGGEKPGRKRKSVPLADTDPDTSNNKKQTRRKKEPSGSASAAPASSGAHGKRTAAKSAARKPKGAVEGKQVKERKPKAAAAKPKPKAKSRARGRGSEVPAHTPADPADTELAQMLVDFAMNFDESDSPQSDSYKKKIKGMLSGLEEHSLNLYWSKCGCGLKIVAEGRDGHHCSFNNLWSPEPWKMAISAKIAYMTALNLERKSPHTEKTLKRCGRMAFEMLRRRAGGEED